MLGQVYTCVHITGKRRRYHIEQCFSMFPFHCTTSHGPPIWGTTGNNCQRHHFQLYLCWEIRYDVTTNSRKLRVASKALQLWKRMLRNTNHWGKPPPPVCCVVFWFCFHAAGVQGGPMRHHLQYHWHRELLHFLTYNNNSFTLKTDQGYSSKSKWATWDGGGDVNMHESHFLQNTCKVKQYLKFGFLSDFHVSLFSNN